MVKVKKATLHIKGMHCPSCEVLMRDQLKELPYVKTVSANYDKREVEVCYTGTLDKEEINKKIEGYGYRIQEKDEDKVQENLTDRLLNITFIGSVLIVLYVLSKVINFDFTFGAVSAELTLPAAFLLGIVASTSTCMATSGALFLATIGKLQHEHSWRRNFVPAIGFNIGRVLTYAMFGALSGLVGKVAVTTFQMGPFVTLSVAVFMLLMGLDMASVIRVQRFIPSSWSTRFFEHMENRLIKSPKKTAFLLGAITYFLPCGFTQTVQAYALGLADPLYSAATLGVFALGTVPALLAIGLLHSLTKTSWYPYVNKIMGSIVLLVGLTYASNFLSIYGISLGNSNTTVLGAQTNAVMENGYQVMRMNVNTRGYSPGNFVLKKGIPARWVINGENVFGCQGSLIAPQLGVQKTLTNGENVIEFTPNKTGSVVFSCSMGMFRGTITVVENI